MDEKQPKPPLGEIIPLHQATLEKQDECAWCGLHRDHWNAYRQCWAKSANEQARRLASLLSRVSVRGRLGLSDTWLFDKEASEVDRLAELEWKRWIPTAMKFLSDTAPPLVTASAVSEAGRRGGLDA